MPHQAWCLHKYNSGDTSARVLFFTEAKGLVRCLYKGGRSPKKQALLQPFTPLWLDLNSKGGWHYVRKLEAEAPTLVFKQFNLFSALYVNELISLALKPDDPHPNLYAAYGATINALSQSKKEGIEAILRRFEWALLGAAGYSISLTEEAIQQTPINPNAHYDFLPGAGFVTSQRGIPGQHLIALSNDELQDPMVLKSAKWIMRRAIDVLLDGRVIKTRSLFHAQ